MSLAIYRKYRPQKWSDLTGQNHIKVTLQNEIESGNVAHAFLFTGPRGVGKTTAARLLAKSLNCTERKQGQSEPCNKCDSCLELVGGNDLDIIEIDAASHTGVDNVRENIIANARFTPVKRKYKVFIIDEVHMLSISAFNALLKILEEPPAHAIFILATTEVHKIPATIISRCQRFDFKKVNADDLIKRLNMICQVEAVKVDKKVLADIARVSEGCLRDAESLLGQVLSLGEKEIGPAEASLIIPTTNYGYIAELVDYLVYKNIESSINLINKLVDESIDLLQFTDELIDFLRKMILSKISGSLDELAIDLDEEQSKQVIDLASKFELNELMILINLFSSKRNEIKTAAIRQLPLEMAVIEYCDKKRQEDQYEQKGNNNNLPPTGGGNSGEDQAPSPKGITETKIKKDDSNSGLKATLKNEKLAEKQVKVNEKIKKCEQVTVKAEENVKINISLDEIKEKWHSFLVQLQDSNASLVFILKVAEPLELSGNVLKIGFKYAFHEQRVNQSQVKEAIEKALAQVFDNNLFVCTCLLDQDHQSDFIKEQTQSDEVELVDEISNSETSTEQKELIDKLVKTFDGKIVE